MHAVAPDVALTVIANTADDDEFWGLLVCPDIDSVIYRLADVFNGATGYGIAGDTFHVLEMLERIGAPSWFRLGDHDIATHLARGEILRVGGTLTDATIDICNRFGVRVEVLPMCDEPVRTRFSTDGGELSFQEYFVRERLRPRLLGIRFAGVAGATPTPRVKAALAAADAVVIGPSNPLISIEPIMKVVGALVPPERTVAVSPLVGGVAIKGPTVEMMRALGHDPTPVTVARMHREFASGFVLDERDRAAAPAIEELGYRTLVCDTVMGDGGRSLARAILAWV